MVESVVDGIDVDALLAPASEAEPAGADLREDFTPQSLYYRLRDARAEARAAERAADSDAAIETVTPPQWRTVRDVGLQALAVSKDLEVGAWLTEALLRSDGLRGLTAGLRLMTGLVERYWDGLYPRPDEDGVATTVAPVAGLNGESGDGTLIQPLRKLVLFHRPDTSPVPFWQYEQSRDLEGIADKARRQQRLDDGAVPLETMETEARAAGGAWFAGLRDEIGAAAEAWRLVGAALDGRAGAESPSTSRVRDLLEQFGEAVARYAPAAREEDSATGVEHALPDAADAGTPVSGAVSRPATREDALRTLETVATFFRRTEPNSPLSYTLQDAVRRARMTWPELLAEVVPDAASRSAILTSLGIRPPEEEA